jgi:hypothetical protein
MWGKEGDAVPQEIINQAAAARIRKDHHYWWWRVAIVDFHYPLTLFFIPGRPTYALKLSYVSKWLVSLSAGHLPTEMRVSSAR